MWPLECHMTAKIDHWCKALTKSGKPCRAAATAGGLCFFHAHPNKASELGRPGGRSKSRVVTEGLDPLPALDNAIAVRDALARLIKRRACRQACTRDCGRTGATFEPASH